MTTGASQVAAHYCRATFNYVGPVPGVRHPVEVDVRNGRIDLESRDFETSGFTMCQHESAVTDWSDQRQINAVHGPEVHAFARDFTGCDVAGVYPAISRGPSMAAKTPDYAPIEFVHSDFTTDYRDMVTNSGRQYQEFLRPMLSEHGLTIDDVRNASRLMVLQLWRNTGSPQPDFPLAVCDARSIDTDRLRPFFIDSYGGSNLGFETYGIAAPTAEPDHWYTFPSLGIDEVLVFRTYDSERADTGLPFWTPHSAFRDPHVPAGAAGSQRESTEMRALCIWR